MAATADLFISRPMFGNITDEQAARSIDLYAEAVMARINGAPAAEAAAL